MPMRLLVSAAVLACCAFAQSSPDLSEVLARLDRLEAQNRELRDEIRKLRAQLNLEERLEVQENRTAEQAEIKVEAAHRFPIRLTGMALFNTFLNTTASGEYPAYVSPASRAAGATVRQTVLGLDFDGPTLFAAGKVSGSLRMDFFGGTGDQLNQSLRVRTAALRIDWKDRNLLFGVDKPIISPREPESLAQVGISPLSGAGNFWYWSPQASFEQTLHFGATGIHARAGIVQTHESGPAPASPYGAPPGVEGARPAFEARAGFFHGGENRRIELATGLHRSTTHALGQSIPSEVQTVDWLARFAPSLDLTGMLYTGRNVAPLGTGGLRQGFVALDEHLVRPVHSRGGWAQLTWRARPRLWFNFFSGEMDDRNRDLAPGAIGRNLAYGANVFFRLAPNVLASFETSQTRSAYLGSGTLLNNHYDLALAYLF